jgi:hypothetical protein
MVIAKKNGKNREGNQAIIKLLSSYNAAFKAGSTKICGTNLVNKFRFCRAF